MSSKTLERLKYPIGKFEKPDHITKTHISNWIDNIEKFPHRINEATKNLSEDQLALQYRPNGWNIKQVVHHCADSHTNSIIRFKLALTEDKPTIRPYFEDRWAKLIDGNDNDLSNTILLLRGLHAKLVQLLRNLNDSDLKREFVHPEHNKVFTIEETIGVYAWHSNHHLAHIKQALELRGEF